MGSRALVDRPEAGTFGRQYDEREEDRVTSHAQPDAHTSLMSPRYTYPSRKWILLHGPYKDQLGAEYCATHDFE